MSHHEQHDHQPHGHSHGGDHDHDHDHAGSAGLARLAPRLFGRGLGPANGPTTIVHRIDRRRFVADLGRGTFAMAVLGAGAVACSSTAAPTATNAPDPTATNAPDPTAAPTAAVDPTAVPTDAVPADAAQTEEQPSDGLLDWAQVSFGFVSAYVLVRGNTAAIVDSGTGGISDLAASLGTFGLNFDDVEHVLLTHAHGDHVGGLPEILESAPAATAYAGALDVPNILAARELTAIGDGDDVFGLQIFDTPGHTPGSISMLDPGIGLLIAGDALNTNSTGDAITAANPSFTPDMSSADASVRKLAELDVQALVVGHGNPVQSGAGTLLTDLAASLA